MSAEQLALARLGVHALARAARGSGDAEEVEDQRQLVVEALVEQQQPAGDPLARGLGRRPAR